MAIGSRHGLDAAAWSAWIASGRPPPELDRAQSVPFFVFNQETSLRGAQPTGVLLQAMGEALAAAGAGACEA